MQPSLTNRMRVALLNIFAEAEGEALTLNEIDERCVGRYDLGELEGVVVWMATTGEAEVTEKEGCPAYKRPLENYL